MAKEMAATPERKFFHPDLFVVPDDGSAPHLLGYKCETCGKTWFPKLDMCPECWTELKQIPISSEGILYSFTIAYMGQKGIKAPYVLGFVDFPEDVRVFGQIAAPFDEIESGMKVKVKEGVMRVEDNGTPVYSYLFEPVK